MIMETPQPDDEQDGQHAPSTIRLVITQAHGIRSCFETRPDIPYFLALPKAVRCRIYFKVGLILDEEYRLSKHPGKGESSPLFWVSRSISMDARRVFYSRNRFQVMDNDTFGLQPLIKMGTMGWENLRQLTVRLCADNCNWLSEKFYNRNGNYTLNMDRLLSQSPQLLSDWRDVCTKLGEHNVDERLDLRLMCGATRVRTARKYLDPLNDLPRLKALSIRLGPGWNVELQQMIYDIIRQNTSFFGDYFRRGPFLYPKLPAELQLLILESPGLIAQPSLVWRGPIKRFVPHDCRYQTCKGRPDHRLYQGQFWCPAMHTAFSSAHPCGDSVNTPWHLVSRNVAADARQIYYKRNIFEVWHSWEDSPAANQQWTPRRSAFLRGLSDAAWDHLRHVRFVFTLLGDVLPVRIALALLNASTINSEILLAHQASLQDWEKTLEFLSQRVRDGTLTLEIVLFPRITRSNRVQSKLRISNELQACDQIMEPVIVCRGHLKDLFVHSYCPAHISQNSTRLRHQRNRERRVMGDDYDSVARGKTPYPGA